MSGGRREVFADTAYWIALLDPDQDLHAAAAQASRTLGAALMVTTEPVLVELLNHFCGRGAYWRGQALAAVDRLRQNTGVVVEPQTRDLFEAGVRLYRERRDKGYSATDCMSMVVMRRRGITDVLTSDHHFEQEGFVALMPTGGQRYV
jgi:predicted nucleic acid-binding protein